MAKIKVGSQVLLVLLIFSVALNVVLYAMSVRSLSSRPGPRGTLACDCNALVEAALATVGEVKEELASAPLGNLDCPLR